SPEYKSKVGVNTSVSWPAGVGAKGNEGVSGLVQQTPGAIGYVELIFALQNKAGAFVTASLESVTAAAANVKMPDDFRISITNAEGNDAYPIASFTWMLLYQNPQDTERAKIMADFLKWALSDGQKDAAALHYAPLPKSVIDLEMAALARLAS